ncbi:MAG: hypothetical protein IJ689_05650 [Alphaproteobacteria bacterium]|nr:hypothetical protein [Alphaproteobacteria bacterium]
MKKYILLLGIAGVALGSYAAYAANSDTMTVSAAITHDINIDIMGGVWFDIIVNPAVASGWAKTDGTKDGSGVVSANDNAYGAFTATVANPGDASVFSISPASVSSRGMLVDTFSIVPDDGHEGDFLVHAKLSYSGGAPSEMDYQDLGEITITYTAP